MDLIKTFLGVVIILAGLFLIYVLVTSLEELVIPGEPEYCKTTFQNGIVKYCDMGTCHNSGCIFECSDGTKIDSSFYTVECVVNE